MRDSQNRTVCSLCVNATVTHTVTQLCSQNETTFDICLPLLSLHITLCPVPYLLMTLSIQTQRKVLTQMHEGLYTAMFHLLHECPSSRVGIAAA